MGEQNKLFRKSLFGYNKKDVNNYILDTSKNIEERVLNLEKESDDLKNENEYLKKEVARLTSIAEQNDRIVIEKNKEIEQYRLQFENLNDEIESIRMKIESNNEDSKYRNASDHIDDTSAKLSNDNVINTASEKFSEIISIIKSKIKTYFN